MYGYNGMGLHRCHPSWWSLVVRSRSAGLTARLLRVLQLYRDFPPENFINGVPCECARSYEHCMGNISRCLEARGVGPTEKDAASTDGSEESEGGELEGGEPEEAPEWADGED